MSTTAPIRISGCLGQRESVALLFELGETAVRLRAPFRIRRERWGRGWALFAVPTGDQSEPDSCLREKLSTLVGDSRYHRPERR